MQQRKSFFVAPLILCTRHTNDLVAFCAVVGDAHMSHESNKMHSGPSWHHAVGYTSFYLIMEPDACESFKSIKLGFHLVSFMKAENAFYSPCVR